MAEDMIELAAKAAMDACEAGYLDPRPDYTCVCVDGDTSFVPIARAAVVTFIGAVSPDALNRAGVPWTLEVAQALDALKRIAQGEQTVRADMQEKD